MRYGFKAAALTLAVLSVGGCLSRSPETTYYDLKVEKRFPAAPPVSVGVFSNRSGAGSRMLVRGDGFAVRQDPANKWLLPPGELVAKYLQSALSAGEGEPETLKGRITVFEADLSKKEFFLGGLYQRGGGKAVNFEFSAPLADDSAESVAAAASACAAKLAEKIAGERGK